MIEVKNLFSAIPISRSYRIWIFLSEGEKFSAFWDRPAREKARCRKFLIGMLPGLPGKCGGKRDRMQTHRDRRFYENIGVDFEFSTMYEKLSAKENLRFFGSLYKKAGAFN